MCSSDLHRLQAQNGTVLGVDVLDVDSDALGFVRRYHLTYPVIRDGDGGSRKSFGVQQQPDTIVIDRRGRIASVVRGPVTEADMRRLLPRLLREPA